MEALTATQLHHLFNSRGAEPKRASDLFNWISLLLTSGAMTAERVEYAFLSMPPLQPFDALTNKGNSDHSQLKWQAKNLFASESPWVEKDLLGYGTADVATELRLVECGSVPPIKLIRAWAVGYHRFTVMPFVDHFGRSAITLSIPVVQWPARNQPFSRRRRLKPR